MGVFRERRGCMGRWRGFVVFGVFCVGWVIVGLFWLVLFCFVLFCLFWLVCWGEEIFSGDYCYSCEVFLFVWF